MELLLFGTSAFFGTSMSGIVYNQQSSFFVVIVYEVCQALVHLTLGLLAFLDVKRFDNEMIVLFKYTA
jgi:predicted MFS family arabinose efflux permease